VPRQHRHDLLAAHHPERVRAAILAGGQSGPAIVPGKPEASLLIRAVSQAEPKLKMPLNGEKLRDPKAVIALERGQVLRLDKTHAVRIA